MRARVDAAISLEASVTVAPVEGLQLLRTWEQQAGGSRQEGMMADIVRREVETICIPGGIANEDVRSGFDLVVLDCSCTASDRTREEGVTDVYPAYAGRKASHRDERIAKPYFFTEPGTARVDREKGVARLFTRWGIGAPTKSAAAQPKPGAGFEVTTDSIRQRDRWYEQALQQLSLALGPATSVAFARPQGVRQQRALQAFAQRLPDVRVAVVQASRQLISDMRARAEQEHALTLQRMSQLAHKEAAAMPTAELRAIATAVCDDVDRSLLASPVGEAPEALPDTQATRDAAAQAGLTLLAQGQVEDAARLMAKHAPMERAADTEDKAQVFSVEEAVEIAGVPSTWGGMKIDSRCVRVTAALAEQLSSSSCRWEWDGGRAGQYRWVEEIEVGRDGLVRRTGVPRAGRYEPPRAARAALAAVKALQYDTAQLLHMALGRIEEARAEQRRQNALVDEQYRAYLRQRLKGGAAPRDVCEALLGPGMATALLATASGADDEEESGVVVTGDEATLHSEGGDAQSGDTGRPGEVFNIYAPSYGGIVAATQKQAERVRVEVSSATAGRNTPMKLRGLQALSAAGTAVDVLHTISDNVPDTGSCTYLCGLRQYEQLSEAAPGAVEVVKQLDTSLTGVTGVGGSTGVLFYIRMRLLCGNCELTLHDVPVVPNIPGLLLGTDVFGAAGANIQFWQTPGLAADGLPADGEMTLRDGTTGAVSTALPFVHRHRTHREVARALGAQGSAPGRDGDAVLLAETAVAEQVIEAAVPVAYAPEPVRVKKWSQRKLRCRVPAALMGDHEVMVIPLDDERVKELGLVIYSTMQKPDKDGYVDVVAINYSGREKEIGLLTPVGRFVVDPTREEAATEFTAEEIMDLINIEPDMSEADRALLKAMIEPNRRLFATVLGYAHGAKMSIKTRLIDEGKAVPPAAPNRTRAREENAALWESVQKQLKAGLIMPCRSPYNAQPVLVRKADWTPEKPSYRVTLDFRPLNALTERDSYPLPNVDANLAALGKAKLFTTADLLMGFHQCELEEHDGSRLKTAFGTPWGQFCYKRMPMGLTSSPGCFMRLVDSALRGLPAGMALAYCDDIIIPTDGDMAAHMQDVGRVFGRLIEAGFTVRCDKVHVAKPEVPYLGFLAGSQGTRPHPDKTKALLDMAAEQLVSEPAAVGRFAGMIGVYAKYIPNCQLLLAPLHDLKQKGANLDNVETLKVRAGFAGLQHLLASATALARPDYTKPFYVDVDSATVAGVGLVVTQREDADDAETHRPLAFGSHKFTDMEKAFPIRDQECFGVYFALQQYRHLLLGAKVVVRTDHKSLKWLMRTIHPDGSRVATWASRLQEYDLDIEWVAGKDHVAADCISRVKHAHVPPEEGPQGVETGGTGDAADERIERLDAMTALAMRTDEVLVAQEANTPTGGQCATLVLLNLTDEMRPQVLLEQHDGTCALPSVMLHESGGTRRAQLAKALEQTYGKASKIFKALKRATRHRARANTAHDLFVVRADEVGAADYAAGTGMVDVTPGLAAFMQADEVPVLRELMTALVGNDAGADGARWFRLRTQLLQVRAGTVYTVDPVWDTACEVYSIAQKPSGPALCRSSEDAQLAVLRMRQRLKSNPGLPLAVDLEGDLGGRRAHVALAQVCVDAVREGEQQLIYVFDTHKNADILGEQGPASLRALLEDEDIPKVLHCCCGDASALWVEYGVKLRHIFDTGLVDTLIRRGEVNQQRGLEKVTVHWLGKEQVQMTHKGKLLFEDRMFEVRPLTGRLFTYAYEDVVYLGRVYWAMMEELRRQDIYELARLLAQQRSPFCAMDITRPLKYPGGTRLAVALVDDTSVVCLCSRDTRTCMLPSAAVEDILPITDVIKQFAQHVWTAQMGAAPKGVAAAIHARPRRPIHLGDTLLMVSAVPSCKGMLEALNTALSGTVNAATHAVVVRSRVTQQAHCTGVASEQRALFQHLFVQADRAQQRGQSRVQEVFTVREHSAQATSEPEARRAGATQDATSPDGAQDGPKTAATSCSGAVAAGIATSSPARHLQEGCCQIRVQLHLSACAGGVQAGTYTALVGRPQATAGEVNIVTGPTITGQRGAIILHDDELVFALNGQDWDTSYAFPSAPVEVGGTAREAALKGFDVMAGAALRRGGAGQSQAVYEAHSLSPLFAKMLTDGFEAMPSVGTVGNTEFFACALQKGTLRNFASAFHMARQPTNGYRLTATLQKRHVGFQLCRIGTALERLQRFDATALGIALAGTQDDATVTRESQRTGVALITALLEFGEETGVTGERAEQGAESVDHPQHSDDAPALGEDPDYDALFEAHVILLMHAAQCGREAREAQHSECGAAYVGLTAAPPITREELLQAQEEHPGTAQVLERLRHGGISVMVEDAAEGGAGAEHSLATDGLLLRHTSKGKRIVVPPQLQRRVFEQCHDTLGHPGVNKSLEVLRQRFAWAGERAMREQLQGYIKTCDPCQRANIHHHAAGVASVPENGDGPCSTWAMDVYSTGLESGGFDSVLNFMCLFSRFVIAEPVNKNLDSEGVCRILLKAVISVFGVPSAIRADNASVFVGEVTRALYKLYKIDLRLSAAYHHQAIGALERFHSVLKKMIMAQRIASGADEWHEFLPMLVAAYNSTVGASGYSPFQIVFLRDARLPIDAMTGEVRRLPQALPEYVQAQFERLGVVWDATAQALLRNSLYGTKRMNLKLDVNEDIRAGDLVLLKKGSQVDNPRMHPKAVEVNDGPFVVERALGRGNFKLTELGTRRIKDEVHISRLTRYFNRDTAEAEEAHSDKRWAVHSIVGHRVTTKADKQTGRPPGVRDIEYKVRWAGLDASYDKWHARPYLHSIWELVKAYNENSKIPAEFAVEPLEAEAQRIAYVPVIAPQAAARAHFRPQDRVRRRQHTEAAGVEASQPPPASAADASASGQQEQQSVAIVDVHEQRRQQREERRREYLLAERRKRDAQALERRSRPGPGTTGAALVAAAIADAAVGGSVRIIAADGTVFEVPREQACLSGTIKAMLTGRSGIEGAPPDEVRFAEVESTMMREVTRYMDYKARKMKKQECGTYTIEGALALQLFRVANYLDI